MAPYMFHVAQDHARLGLWNKEGPREGHYPVLHQVLNLMGRRGFQVGRDPEIERDYKILGKDHWYGRKGDLEFKAQRYPNGFEIEFFQNIVFENRHGGFYDFGKFSKMPYLVKLLFINEVRHVKQLLEGLGCTDRSKPVFSTSVDKVKWHYVEDWHHPQRSMDFQLESLHGLTPEHPYNHTDRDKKVIKNGDVKYFRDWRTGRLMRGTVYHNINNMWWVILNTTEYRNIADFDLFDPNENDFAVRRLKKGQKPKEYLETLAHLERAKTKELIRELKRRGAGNLLSRGA